MKIYHDFQFLILIISLLIVESADPVKNMPGRSVIPQPIPQSITQGRVYRRSISQTRMIRSSPNDPTKKEESEGNSRLDDRKQNILQIMETTQKSGTKQGSENDQLAVGYAVQILPSGYLVTPYSLSDNRKGKYHKLVERGKSGQNPDAMNYRIDEVEPVNGDLYLIYSADISSIPRLSGQYVLNPEKNTDDELELIRYFNVLCRNVELKTIKTDMKYCPEQTERNPPPELEPTIPFANVPAASQSWPSRRTSPDASVKSEFTPPTGDMISKDGNLADLVQRKLNIEIVHGSKPELAILSNICLDVLDPERIMDGADVGDCIVTDSSGDLLMGFTKKVYSKDEGGNSMQEYHLLVDLIDPESIKSKILKIENERKQ